MVPLALQLSGPAIQIPTSPAVAPAASTRRATARASCLALPAAAVLVLSAIWLTHGASDGMAAMFAIFAASLISSTAGFAFSGLCGAALFHLVGSPGRAVEIMLVCSVANQSMMTWVMRDRIIWPVVARYAAGGMVGVLAGIAMINAIASSTYVLVAGAFLICYGAHSLFARTPRLPDLPPAFDIVIGLLSGLFGGVLAFPSVLVVIWTGCKGIDRHAQRAIYQPYVLLMQFVAIGGILLVGQLHPGRAHFRVADLLYMPVALLGTAIGLRLFGRATEGQFKAVVSTLLIVSGAALMF